MSLETSLELNNKLLTQHNALIERLIEALTTGAAVQPGAAAQVQQYRETVKASSKEKQQARKGPFYWKHPESEAFGSVDDIDGLNALLDDGLTVEINKVEYLQLKESADKGESTTADAPDYAALRKQAEECIKTLCKGGYRAEAVGILDSFGAKKLGEVEDKDLASLVAQAEKALEG
ncbi:hypothetical protein [Pluralibacter gergoviae]|uniref:hypothetical protein n=1 Tax=Pluralibacter gergoviae TaxID=61647 RepID=UPI000651E153|nr:hypothetical protein [Pluralibacter gergoviae]ELN2739386.1 hypothetical protein [Pluralibacter gergoviae]ELN2739712.1 hypothetical protein [Pluralibacter gergoviae]KMK29544.1 hypothetical protein ABW12_22250 [Pluralibacter gergoviae]